jgi:hypothetical protein
VNDVLLTPISGWPQELKPDIDLPQMRFVSGTVPVELDAEGGLPNFLRLKKGSESTLFGGFRLAKPVTKTIPLALGPLGIELAGSLPDPTRDLLSPAVPDARISGVFRLEGHHDPEGRKTSYWLRLIRGDDPKKMDQLEARIAQVFATLAGEIDAPLAVRFDRRPDVPPLYWPLIIESNKLNLVKKDNDFEFDMAIDPLAIDARVRTDSRFPGDLPGIASIHSEHLVWRKHKDGFDVTIEAGSKAIEPKVVIEFERKKVDPVKWSGRLAAEIKELAVEMPLDVVSARLLTTYKAAKVVRTDETRAPYAFFPLVDGWLQLDLKNVPKVKLQPPLPRPSAMSGRIVAAQGEAVDGMRGVVVDDAGGLSMTVRWRVQSGQCLPHDGSLTISHARGQLRGFLFVADTAPTAAEALPDLRRGPAATRDVPMTFNSVNLGILLQGKFKWTSKGDWSLDQAKVVELISKDEQSAVSTPAGPTPAGYGWMVPHGRPFVTNHPLTRSAVVPAEPSVSRGLLRYSFTGNFKLEQAGSGGAPVLSPLDAPSAWDGLRSGDKFRADTLVLTTLPGAEFTLTSPPGKAAKFEAALRHDLSILDELFAWSDPPPTRKGDGAVREDAVIITALDPPRLEAVWEQNRIRMALTRTQDAFMTAWVDPAAAGLKVDIDTLVQPFPWKDISLKFDLSERWGRYELAGQSYALEKALAGLQKDFVVRDGKLEDGDRIAVRGNAASLFRIGDINLLWDSRGTGFAPALSAGVRPVGSNGQMLGELRTLDKVETIDIDTELGWMKASLQFFMRDVHFVHDPDLEKYIFDGTKNPVEGAVGATGQAFDRDTFLGSLHEWRLFEKSAETPKPFDIRFGPFLFSPLRLERVEVVDSGRVSLIQVIGGLRLGRRPADNASAKADDGPFGADRVYLRSDLFRLQLKKDAGKWKHAWSGVALTPSDPNGPSLKFVTREPKVTCNLALDVDPAGIRSSSGQELDAAIELDIVSRKVRFGARLFGRQCLLDAQATINEGVSFTISAKETEAESESLGLLRVDTIEVNLKVANQSVRFDGALLLMPRKTKIANAELALVLFAPSPASFRWLELSASDAGSDYTVSIDSVHCLTVDHASGRVSTEWEGDWAKATPLFGLTATNPFGVLARLEAFVAGLDKPLQHIAPLPLGSAWARIAGVEQSSTNRIDHRLFQDADATEHRLELSWCTSFSCPVQWPVNRLKKRDGSRIPPEWLVPEQSKSTEAERSREIRIEAGGALSHGVKMRLKRHGIEASALRRIGKQMSPVTPIALLVVVEHELREGTSNRQVMWKTFDHVMITSFGLIIKMAKDKVHAFAARYRQRLYRGQNISARVPHPGIVELPWAVSGFFDEALIRHYESPDFANEIDTPIFVGAATVLFPERTKAGVQAVAAVIPWMGISRTLRAAFGPLTQAGGEWRVASPDLWGGSPYRGPGAERAAVLPEDADATRSLAEFETVGLASGKNSSAILAKVLPVEQLFFENLRAGSNGQIQIAKDQQSRHDLPRAPFFLRALLAIETRWNETHWKKDMEHATWQAFSLHPARGASGGTRATPVMAVEIKQLPADEPATDRQLVPADLISLSHARAERQHAYRLIDPTFAEDVGDRQPRAELIARARDLDRFAEYAIREVEREGALPAIAIVPIPQSIVVRSGRSGLEINHPVLAPSAALGWPTDDQTRDLDKLAPRLGAEFPVQSPEAGFSARFHQIGLPASTPDVMTYLSFAHRVTFDRDTRVPFNGPAARHLSPVNTRLRAPTDREVFGEPSDGPADIAADGPRDAVLKVAKPKPIVVPFAEFATIGRRPGVFEVVTAAMTVAADGKALDPHHDRFGRPANSSPVVAHQLRTPRSPALPNDAADFVTAGEERDVLKFRRRTFLSLADSKPAGEDFVLDQFRQFDRVTDVLRREMTQNQKIGHLRVALSLTSDKSSPSPTAIPWLLGPNWNGELILEFEAAKSKELADPLVALRDLVTALTARLDIGPASFAMQGMEAIQVAWPSFTWTISAKELLPAAQDELGRASVDTPIRLVITFGSDRPLAADVAPQSKAILPLALDPRNRRVLKTRTETIAFGDPSYDRQLGSATEGDIKQIGSERVLLSVDRQEYDTGATLYFACGEIDLLTGLFSTASSVSKYSVRFRRLGEPKPDGTARAPDDLTVAGLPLKVGDTGYEVKPGKPYEISLQLLRQSGADDVSPLEPGDRLEVSVDVGDKPENVRTLTVFVNIVAAPVIAPPPCVYSVIDSTLDDPAVSRVVLHAAAPLPQHIEFPNLGHDLAKGYVNRRALFVWHFARIGAVRTHTELVKYDRSGGAQLPRSQAPPKDHMEFGDNLHNNQR